MQLGLHEDTFVWLGQHYKAILEDLSYTLGTVVSQLAGDETVGLPAFVVSPCGNYVEGSCGLIGTPEAPHSCSPMRLKIGSGSEGYDDICRIVKDYVMGHCACVALVPLVRVRTDI